MNRDSGEQGEREDVQKTMVRWGTSPVPVAPSEVLEARRQRGLATLRASIGSAKREGQARRLRFALAGAAATALVIWAGVGLAPGAGLLGSADGTEAAALEPRAFVDGPCEVARGQAGWVRSAPGRAVMVGDRVRALDTPVDVRLDRVTSARVAPGSVLAISALADRRQELRLVSGRSDFEVDPKRSAEVVVYAESTRILVTGTAFSVVVGQSDAGDARDARARTWSEVSVQHGRVEVASRGEVFLIGAGESWSSREQDAPHEHGEKAASLASSRMPTTPFASASAAQTQKASEPSAPGELQDEELATTLSEENRLFRAALSARNGGNDARCVALLSEFLAKFPSSPLRQEAMVAELRCLRSSGNTMAAHRTAQRYLTEYPNGFARSEARDLVLVAPAEERKH